MAIRWGHSSGRLSLGIDLSWSGDPNSGYVTVTAVYYVRADGYGHNFHSTVRFSGDATGSKAYSFYSPTGGDTVKEVHRTSWRKNTAYGAATSSSVSFRTDTIWNGGAPSASASVSIPARAYHAPAPPTAVSARRDSDTQITVSWQQATSTAAPVHSFAIERMSESDPVWRRVGTVNNGGARSWTDTSVSAGQKYTYRVWAGNGKQSPAAASPAVATTPAPPTNVTAEKTDNGDILVSWVQPRGYRVAGYTIYDGGTQVGTAPAGSQSWVHHGPAASATHSYKVRADEGRLHSELSAPSNTVQLLTTPGLPRVIGPVGVAPSDAPVVFKWAHTSLDTSAQTKAEVRYRARNGGSWNVRTVNGSGASLSVQLQTGTYEFQIRTWGAYKQGQEAGASPWSSTGQVVVAARPTAVIVEPDDTCYTANVTVEWNYRQAAGIPQSRATVTLSYEGTLIETKTVNGSANTVTLDTRLENLTWYDLELVVTSANGLSSLPETHEFDAYFRLPERPNVLAKWDEAQGCAQVTLVNPAPQDYKADTAHNLLLRSVDGGVSWETVASRIPLGGSVSDFEALSNGTTLYKGVAYTELDTSAAGEAVELSVKSNAVWLSAGAGFAKTVGLRLEQRFSERRALVNREVVFFAGRRKGVELAGVQEAAGYDVAGRLLYSEPSELQAWRAVTGASAPVLLRTPAGDRFYCSIANAATAYNRAGFWDVAAKLDEVER